MSLFRYNGVYIHLSKTDFTVTDEKDPSGSDVLWYKYTVKVRGFISPSLGQFPGVSGADQSHVMQAALQHHLQAPRRSLLYQIGNTTILEQDGGMDAHLGPFPVQVHVKAPVAGVYPVDFTVECRKSSCGDECDVGHPVVSLRWEQTESFGENWEATLTTSGLLICRSDLLLSADSFRPLCVPPVLPDYKRVQSSYTLSPDGTRLRFNFVDKEYDRLPPYPATKADGQFVVQVTNGAKRVGNVRVKLEGQKGTSRSHLMLVAIYMAYAKLHKENARGNEPFPNLPLMSGNFREGMTGEVPIVEVELTSLLPPLGGNTTAIQPGPDGIIPPKMIRSIGVETYGLSSDQPGIPHPIRKRVLGLVSNVFRDPCACQDGVADLIHVNEFGNSELRTEGRTTEPATLTIGSTEEDLKTHADEDPYDYYECDTEWDWDEGNALLPGTGVGENGHVGKMVQLHGGRMFMYLIWVARRTGKPPVLPAYLSPDPNYEPMRANYTARHVEPNADNTQLVWTVCGYYKYGVVDPKKVDYAAPILPFYTELVAGASDVLFANSKAVVKGGPSTANPIDEPAKDVGEIVLASDVPGFEPQQPGFADLPQGFWGIGGFQDLSPGAGGPPVNP